jgi:hypothetical protein
MSRIDDYLQARKIAIEKLKSESFDALIERSGFEPAGPAGFRVPFLDRLYSMDFPACNFIDLSEDAKEIPLQEQVVILHYLLGAGAGNPTGEPIPYREIPGASLYHSVFIKRAVDPLKSVFGRNPSRLSEVAGNLGGKKAAHGDVGIEFFILPKVPIQLILWEGDEEFPPEANILFDRSIAKIHSPEDAAWMASLLVYRLIALAKQPQS